MDVLEQRVDVLVLRVYVLKQRLDVLDQRVDVLEQRVDIFLVIVSRIRQGDTMLRQLLWWLNVYKSDRFEDRKWRQEML